MSDLQTGLLIGLFVGCWIGMFGISLFIVAKRADRRIEEMRKGRVENVCKTND